MGGVHQFSPLDEIIPPLYEAFIYGFPCPFAQKENVLKVLEEGWSKTLHEWPMLRGEIGYDQSKDTRPGTLKLKIPESRRNGGFVVNDLSLPGSSWNSSYEDLRSQGVPPSKLDGEVLAPLVCGIGATTRVVTVQLNSIPGGYLLAFCSSHSFMDAKGCSLVLGLWARHCRDLQASPRALTSDYTEEPQHEEMAGFRTSAMKNGEYDALKHRSELWHLLGLHATENLNYDLTATTAKEFCHIPAAVSPPDGPKTTTCIFSIKTTSLRRLKQDASPKTPAWISSGDALVALIWRCIMRARCPPAANRSTSLRKDSIVTVAIDGRKLLTPPILTSYIGNVVFCCMTSLPLGILLSPTTTLAETAVAIRRNVDLAKKDKVLDDSASLAATIPAVSSLKIAFKDFLGVDLITTSWIELPFYDIDFGPIFGKTGRAEFFRIPRGQFGGICSFQPRQTNGVIDVSILLEVDQMNRLRTDKEFVAYMDFVAE